MSKPKIYANCDAGCRWETIHKDDFVKIIPYIDESDKISETGYFTAEVGKTYRLFKTTPNAREWGFNIYIDYMAPVDGNHEDLSFNLKNYLPECKSYSEYLEFRFIDMKVQSQDIDFENHPVFGTGSFTVQEVTFIFEINGEEKTHTEYYEDGFTPYLTRLYFNNINKVHYKNERNDLVVKGEKGSSVYIKHADDLNGTNMTSEYTRQSYLGYFVGDYESFNPLDYTWMSFEVAEPEDNSERIEALENKVAELKAMLFGSVWKESVATYPQLNVGVVDKTDDSLPIVSNQYGALKEIKAFSEVKVIMNSYTFTGDETWSAGTGGYGFAMYNFVSTNGLKPVSSNSEIPNISISIYTTTKASDITNSLIDNAISINTSGSLLVRDTSVLTPTEMANKMKGKTIYFATNQNEIVSSRPTTLTAYGYNLLNINRTQGTLNGSDFTKGNQQTFKENEYYVGISKGDYIYRNGVLNVSINGNSVSGYVNQGGYGIGFPVKIKGNQTYSYGTANGTTNDAITCTFYDKDGYYISYATTSTFTSPANAYWCVIILSTNTDKVSFTTSDIWLSPLNEGYQPYIEPSSINLTLPETFISADNAKDKLKVVAKANGLYDLVHVSNVGSVLIPDLPWIYGSNGFSCEFLDMKNIATLNAIGLLCPNYTRGTASEDKSIRTTGKYIGIVDSAYNDVASFITANAGVPIYFELAIPTETTIASDLTFEQISTLLQRGGSIVADVAGCDVKLDVVGLGIAE